MNFDDRFKMNVIKRRFREFLCTEVILSVLATLANIFLGITQRYHLVIFLGIMILAFMGVSIWQMRRCYYDIRDILLHYKLNFIAYMMFAVLSLVVCLIFPGMLFTWLFSITKFLKYLGFGQIVSLLIFHLSGIVAILVSPLGANDEIREYEEY